MEITVLSTIPPKTEELTTWNRFQPPTMMTTVNRNVTIPVGWFEIGFKFQSIVGGGDLQIQNVYWSGAGLIGQDNPPIIII